MIIALLIYFFSPTIRQDFVDYIEASMRELISIFGSVRAGELLL
jgi:hypothetical protein